MYLGLMKRGVQLLLAFFLLVGFASSFYGLEFITIPLAVVLYVYSFFDGYSIFRNIKAGKVVEDESVIKSLDSIGKILTNGYWIGLVLVVFGVIALLQGFRYSGIFNQMMYQYINVAEEFIPAAILFILGIFLMVKGNKNRKANKEERHDRSLDR